MLKEKFAQNLKNIRKAQKLTQEKLAELVGVDFRYISFLENAKSFPSCELIEKLVKALDVTYSDLFVFEKNLSREQLENKFIQLVKKLDDKDLNKLYKIAKEFI